MTAEIPFNRPTNAPGQERYVRQAIESAHWSGDGPFTRECHRILEHELGVPRALLTTSCTHALELAALLLEIGPGDDIVVPSFTFVSTINAFVLRGARPVFVDIRPDTLNLDERVVEERLTPQSRVIVPVHYGGVGCEMDSIGRLAERYGLAIVEDNAHGLFGRYRGRYLGTFGVLATQSFHATKNITCGEGGALLINDVRHAERAEILREKGTDRSKFFRGEVDKYGWVDLGSSYLPSEILAAILRAQLEGADEIQAKRCRLWERYYAALSEWAAPSGAQLPTVPAHCEQAYHMFYVLLPGVDERDALLAHLRERGIHAVFHYQPLHLSRMGRRYGGREGQCPVTESVADRLLRLPFYTDMTDDEQDRVVEAVLGAAVAKP